MKIQIPRDSFSERKFGILHFPVYTFQGCRKIPKQKCLQGRKETFVMANALKAERANLEALDQIVLGVAHELNNPNAFIRMNTLNLKKMFRLLRPCLDEYEKRHPEKIFGPYSLPELRSKFNQHLESILEASVRIITIADHLKQCTSDSLERRCEVSLPAVIKDMLQAHEFRLGESLKVNLDFDESKTFTVLGHRLQLEQTVSVLLGNACDAIVERYGSEGIAQGRLGISITERDDRVLVRVSDNGTGMSSETLEKVFVPYFTTKPQGAGDGLGLPICRSVITRHGGTIAIESQEGAGTKVTIELPKPDKTELTIDN